MVIKVLIADDSLMFRKLIERYLQNQPDVLVVGKAIDGAEAVTKAKELQPDVVFLDVDMPDQVTSTTCTAIRQTVPAAKIYLCSAHADPTLKEIAFSTNADGIVRKSSLRGDLLKIIRAESKRK